MFLSSLKQRSRSTVLFAAVLVLLSVPAISQAKTVDEILRDNPGVTYFAGSNKFYKFVNGRFSWPDANNRARSTTLEGVNGRLVEIRSAEEQAFVSGRLRRFCWLGGTDRDQEGRWVWLSDGKQFADSRGRSVNGMYANWYSGEPNNYNGNEDYMVVWDKAYRGGKWADMRSNPHDGQQYCVEWGASDLGIGREYFVRATGNDNNDGLSKGNAFRRIHKAMSVATAGATIYVGAGRYFDELRAVHSGTSSSPIRFVADTKGTKTGDAGAVSTEKRIEIFDKHHIHFTGFKLTRGGNGIQTRNATGIKIDQCESFGNYRSFDIQRGSAIEISRTIVRNNSSEGVRVTGGTVIATNCLFVSNGDSGIQVDDNSARVTVRHCTAANNRDDGIDVDHGTATITNCISAYNKDDGFDGNKNTTHSHNLAFRNGSRDFEGISRSGTEIIADPKFKNAAGNDFHLADGSPAIDKATGSESVDIAGTSRPVGAGRDIGCYEGGSGGGGGGGSSDEYFVRRSGNDRNDGRSKETAFRTIVKATLVARAGNTVYIGAGTYSEDPEHRVDGTSSNPIRFVGDKTGAKTGDSGTILIRGDVTVDGADYTQFEGLNFTNSSTVIKWGNCNGGLLKNCDISGGNNGLEAKNLTLTIEGCTFHDLRSDGAKLQEDSTVTIRKSVFAKSGKNGLRLDRAQSITIEDCKFDNNADDAVSANNVARLDIRRCSLLSSGDDGLDIERTRAVVTDCLIAFNRDDGVEWERGAHMDLFHCTVVGNRDDGVAIYESGPTGTVRNNIIALNRDKGIENYGRVSHSYNLVYGNRGGDYRNTRTGTGEINVDPRFVSSGDFHLRNDSPAINKAVGTDSVLDLDSKKRPAGPKSEFGCYESGATGGPVDPPIPAGDYYVRTSGNDRNNGKSPDKAFRTIGKSVAVAKPGEKVFVGPGSYRESVTVRSKGSTSKNTVFQGDPTGKATGDRAGDVMFTRLEVDRSHGYLFEDFTISGSSSEAVKVVHANFSLKECKLKGRTNGLTSTSSNVKVSDCEFSGMRAIGYSASGGSHSITNCKFVNGRGHGISTNRTQACVIDGSKFEKLSGYGIYNIYNSITIKNCQFDGVRRGIEVRNTTSTVSNCTIRNCSDWGFVQQQYKGTISDLTVDGCAHGFYVVGYRANDIKMQNIKLKNIRGQGIHLHKGQADVDGEGTQVAGRTQFGVAVHEGTLTLNNGTVSGAQYGLYMRSAKVTSADMKLAGCTVRGVDSEHSHLVAKQFDINSSRYEAMNFKGGSLTLSGSAMAKCTRAINVSDSHLNVSDCTIRDASDYGIYSSRPASHSIVNCQFNNIGNYAIYNRYNASKIENVQIDGARRGIELSNTGQATVNNVSIKNCSDWGFVQQQYKGTISDLTIDNCGHGFYVVGYRPHDIKMQKVTLKNIRGQGIHLHKGKAEVDGQGTQIAGRTQFGVAVHESQLTLNNATITGPRYGFYLRNSDVTTGGIKFTGCTVRGVDVEHSRLTATKIDISNTAREAMNFNGGSLALSNSVIAKCTRAVNVSSSKVQISDCKIRDASDYGVYTVSPASHSITNCQFNNIGNHAIYNRYNSATIEGVQIDSARRGMEIANATVTVKSTSIKNCSDWGYVQQQYRGTISDLTIDNCGHGFYVVGYRPHDIQMQGVKLSNIRGQGIHMHKEKADVDGGSTQIAGRTQFGVRVHEGLLTLNNATIQNPKFGLYLRASNVTANNVKLAVCTVRGVDSEHSSFDGSNIDIRSVAQEGLNFVGGQLILSKAAITKTRRAINVTATRMKVSDCDINYASEYGIYSERPASYSVTGTKISKVGQYGIYNRYNSVNIEGVQIDRARRGIELVGTVSTIKATTIKNCSDWGYVQQQYRGNISNLTIDTCGHGFYVTGYRRNDISMQKVKLKNVNGQGIYMRRASADVDGEATQVSGGGRYGIQLNESNLTLTNGLVRNQGNYGVLMQSSNANLSNLTIAGSRYHGIYSQYSTWSLRKSAVKNSRYWGIVTYGGKVTLANNLIVNNPYGVYHYSPHGGTMVNNTVTTSGDYGLYTDRGNIDVYNNIFAGSGRGYGLTNNHTQMNHTHNLVSGYRSPFYRTTQHETEITTSPKFVDATNGNYAHAKGSAAINAGKDVSLMVSTDYDGVNRPQTRVYDLGAHEFKGIDGGFRVLKWIEKE